MDRRFDSRELHRLRADSDEPPPLSADDPLIGRLLSERYRVLRKIDEGAQASIYLARHSLIKRTVALKVLSLETTSDRDLVRRLLDEGQVAGTMGHPNIVESLDMGVTADGRPYLVLEFLDGPTIARDLYKRGAYDVGRAAYIGRQIASALAATHARGIIHLDLKPENVFLIERSGRSDHVKVIDFGISKFLARPARPELVAGTPEFMAPEQITSPATVDARTDIYALGAMLYEMLAGRSALGDTTELDDVLAAVVQGTPTSLAELRPDLPPALVTTIERAMQKAPEMRHAKMTELKNELDVFAVVPPRISRRSMASVTANEPTTDEIDEASSTSLAPSSDGRDSASTHAARTSTKSAFAQSPTVEKKRRVGVVVSTVIGTFCIGAALIFGTMGAVRQHPGSEPATTSRLAEPASSSSAHTLEGSAPSATIPARAAVPIASASATTKGGSAPSATASHASGAPTPSRHASSVTPSAPTLTNTAAPSRPPVPVPSDAPSPKEPPKAIIEPSVVEAVVRSHEAQVQGCVDQARTVTPDVHGQVDVYASVDASGGVASASAVRATTGDTMLEGCLVRAFRTWTFPPPAGGGTAIVSHTFYVK